MSDAVPPADSSPSFRLRRELAETAARGTPGGVFYLLGWLVVGGVGGEFRTRPLLSLLLLAVFAALAFARVLLARRAAADVRRQLALWWALLLATAACWGGITVWVLLDPALAHARMACVICTIAYATATVHTFSMRWRGTLACVALLFLPSLVLTWALQGASGVAVALAIYLVYLLSALRLSRSQYERELRLEQALRDQRDQFERQSRTDALTGLDNRREFTVGLEQAFQASAPLSLLLIDIDHFKLINDRHGHAAGDAVLVALAAQLRAYFADVPASLARIGGEEFTVLLPGMTEADALLQAEQLCAHIAATPCDGRQITLSAGVGQRRRTQRRPDELLAEVDRALYRAKAGGRNRVCRAA
jgi:diguanylate cyclase